MQVKNKAAVNAPWLYLYVQPSLCHSHWCTPTPMATLGTSGVLVYPVQRGASLVVRFTCKGIRQPQSVKRATVQGFTLSFCLYINLVKPAVAVVLGR